MKLKCSMVKCTGCMACYNACPKSAIRIKLYKGFYYPEIDQAICVDCGKCNRVCPNVNPVIKNNPIDGKAWAVFNKNKQVRDKSSSGGVFSVLAGEIIKRRGVVYGAEWHVDLSVRITRAADSSDLEKFRGSKYVQSLTADSFKYVKKDLENGKWVLYSGISCQIAGLLNYLGAEYERLITCEVICHGGASPAAFQEHLLYMEENQQSKVVAVNFRCKTKEGCQNLDYLFQNGNHLPFRNPMEDLYYRGFQNGKLLRESCFSCAYVGRERAGDILIGDFWGLKRDEVEYPDELSYPSLVLVNTRKGMGLWQDVKEGLYIFERPLKEAYDGNLSFKRCIPRSIWRNRFFKEFEKNGYRSAAEHCLADHFNIKEWVKKQIGPKITAELLRILRR